MLFLKLLTAHLIGDYVVQSDRVASGKHRPTYLGLHAVGHATLLFLVGLTEPRGRWLWVVLAGVLVSHVVVDAWTSRRKVRDWKLLCVDQFLHFAALVIAVGMVRPSELQTAAQSVRNVVTKSDVYYVLSGATVAIWAGAVVVGRWVAPFASQLAQRPGLEKAGRTIGLIERALIFLAVVLRLEALVGFVVAAKAILRLPEAREPGHGELAEYYLVGSLASVLWAVLAGVATRWALSGQP
jgi:hypothetical protein